MAILTVDFLEICDRPPVRGTLLLATANAGAPTGLYVGRSPAGIDWVAWPEQGQTRPTRGGYEELCSAFDAAVKPYAPHALPTLSLGNEPE
jgi:hypothetical protein